MDQPNRIPFRVNFLLTSAFVVQSFCLYLFARKDITKGVAHISTFPFLRDHLIVQLVVGIMAICASVVLFVIILRTVLNSVFITRFSLQRVTFSEAYAVTILIFALSCWFLP
jgi:hypothetical protein